MTITRKSKIAANKSRNEVDVKLNDHNYVCKMSFATITEIEDYFDKSMLEIFQYFESGKFRIKQVADVIEISAVADIDREQLESDLEEVGSLFAVTALTQLLKIAFVGSDKNEVPTDNDTKSQRPTEV